MIYVFLAEGFEEVEALTPVDVLRRAGRTVQTVGVTGKTVSGAHGIAVQADIEAKDIALDDALEMIVLPGGMPGTLNLEKSDAVQAAIAFCAEHDRYIAAICAAPSILGHLGLLRGRHAVCYPGFEDALAGAEVLTRPTVTDGRFITGRGPGAAMDFALALTAVFCGDEFARGLGAQMVWNV